mmetsp:Transcript_21550/g.21918  ORF Transcript_21550/g.21918 Transcript_21550/m.21918 type:complete len:101 (-) Transcript_21550:910-1212(-)
MLNKTSNDNMLSFAALVTPNLPLRRTHHSMSPTKLHALIRVDVNYGAVNNSTIPTPSKPPNVWESSQRRTPHANNGNEPGNSIAQFSSIFATSAESPILV